MTLVGLLLQMERRRLGNNYTRRAISTYDILFIVKDRTKHAVLIIQQKIMRITISFQLLYVFNIIKVLVVC